MHVRHSLSVVLRVTGLVTWLVTALAVGPVIGCGSKPPPAPPPPAVIATPKPPPPKVVEVPKPPPAPPCEALAEMCPADKATAARIAHTTDLIFTPPLGWIYAQESDASIAQVNDAGPGFAVAAIELASKDSKDFKDAIKSAAAHDAEVQTLGKRLGLTLPKQKINWKKADKTVDVAGHPFALHQIEGAMRAGKKGPLLVFTTALGDTAAIVGVGFVDDDDKTDADVAILEAIKSMRAPPPKAAPSESLETKP